MLSLILAVAPLTCGSPAEVDRQLDSKVLALRLGTVLHDTAPDGAGGGVVMSGQDPHQAHVQLFASDGRRSGHMALVCTRDDDWRITGCSLDQGRRHTVVITRAQFADLKQGQAIGQVLAELCPPESVSVADVGGFELRYTMDVATEAYLPFTDVAITFDKAGRLVAKREGHR